MKNIWHSKNAQALSGDLCIITEIEELKIVHYEGRSIDEWEEFVRKNLVNRWSVACLLSRHIIEDIDLEQQLQAKDEEIKELNEKIGKDNVVDYHYHRKREFELLKEIEELKNKENRSDGIIGGLLNEGKSLQNKLQQAKDRAYRCLMYLSEKGEYQYLGLSEAVDLIEKEIKETLEIINKE